MGKGGSDKVEGGAPAAPQHSICVGFIPSGLGLGVVSEPHVQLRDWSSCSHLTPSWLHLHFELLENQTLLRHRTLTPPPHAGTEYYMCVTYLCMDVCVLQQVCRGQRTT